MNAPPIIMREKTLVIHIGPHKTGTTSLQRLLYDNRKALQKVSVDYVGSRLNHHLEALSLMRREGLDGSVPAAQHWKRLVRAVEESTAQVRIISSEHLSFAEPSDLDRIVNAFSGFHVRVLVTARPLERVVPSLWLHFAQTREFPELRPWVASLFDGHGVDNSVWASQRYDYLVERWSVVDAASEPTVLVPTLNHVEFARNVEAACWIPRGTLHPGRTFENPRLTQSEVEFSRVFETAIRNSGYPNGVYVGRRRIAPSRVMRSQGPSARPQSSTPLDADQALMLREVDREVGSRLESMSLRWIGDRRELVLRDQVHPGGRKQAASEDLMLPVEQATFVTASLIEDVARYRQEAKLKRIGPLFDQIPEVRTLPLVGILYRRAVLNVRKVLMRVASLPVAKPSTSEESARQP